MLVTHEGMSLRFHEDDARPMGRGTAGVMGIRPVEGDFVVGLALVTQGSHPVVAAENGIGKRTPSTTTASNRAAARASSP